MLASPAQVSLTVMAKPIQHLLRPVAWLVVFFNLSSWFAVIKKGWRDADFFAMLRARSSTDELA